MIPVAIAQRDRSKRKKEQPPLLEAMQGVAGKELLQGLTLEGD
jgi:hypothetical protein